MPKIKLLVFDIDGTLITYGKDTVEESALAAINQAKALGIHVLIATGRAYYLIQEDIKQRVQPEHYVTINGACLTDGTGETIEGHFFTPTEVELLINYVKENNLLAGFKYEKFVSTIIRHEEFVQEYLRGDLRTHHIIKAEDMPTNSQTSLPMGVFIIGPRSHKRKLKELIPSIDVVYAIGDSLEAFPQGIDKSKTIESVINHYGLSWENVAVFGDAGNDAIMLEKAGLGVAMGNAEDFVKEHADYVTSAVDQDGIALALKHFQII